LAILKDVVESICTFLYPLQITGTHSRKGFSMLMDFLRRRSYCGIGRKPEPVLVLYPNPKYAKVCKKREKVRLVEVIQCVVYGDLREVMQLLDTDSG
jgi:hypothetical protein